MKIRLNVPTVLIQQFVDRKKIRLLLKPKNKELLKILGNYILNSPKQKVVMYNTCKLLMV